MTRLVVHAGTHATGWGTTCRQLLSWREPLDAAGVRLHPSNDVGHWAAQIHHLATGTASVAVREAVDAAVRDDADVVLLSSERLEDPLRDHEQVATLVGFAAEAGLPLTVMLVLRDQLGYLNQVYCERIGQLQMARDFPSFAAEPSPWDRFDYASAFRPLLDSSDLTFVAVPFSEMRPGAEAKAVLAAVGVGGDELGWLPETDDRDVLPGPLLVAADRLLFKRLWRLGLVSRLSKPELVRAARRLATHAGDARWDQHPFWGWDARTRAAAVMRFGPGNDALAQEVWGRPWGADWEDGEFVDVDLPARDPLLVVDMLDAIETIVVDLQAARTPVASE